MRAAQIRGRAASRENLPWRNSEWRFAFRRPHRRPHWPRMRRATRQPKRSIDCRRSFSCSLVRTTRRLISRLALSSALFVCAAIERRETRIDRAPAIYADVALDHRTAFGKDEIRTGAADFVSLRAVLIMRG